VTDIIRVAAVGDLHCAKTTVPETFKPLFTQVSELADVLLLCGDLTDYGLPDEARLLARELTAARVPIVGVFGNHDYESDNADEVCKILNGAGVTLLDGDGVEVKGIGFAGCKGFAGGFGERALQAWGEPTIKAFVRAAVDEALKLERALARLRTPRRVAVLHYAPIAATVAGEYPEITAFLGSSRLEEPINRYNVSAVVHGHAHRGQPEGMTSTGVPVYNVAMPLLRRHYPDRPPFRIIEIPVERAPQSDNGGGNGSAAHVPAGGPAIAKIA
jgi:Icc-related predicted phosphoesterase